MTYILVIWTIISISGNSDVNKYHDYRPIGEFSSEKTCMVAGEQLKLSSNRPFVCLKK